MFDLACDDPRKPLVHRRVRKLNLTLIASKGTDRPFNAVCIENFHGAYVALNHLLKLGRKRILLIFGQEGHYCSNDLYSPYALAHNIGCHECESPWMSENADFKFFEGIAVCIDIFLVAEMDSRPPEPIADPIVEIARPASALSTPDLESSVRSTQVHQSGRTNKRKG